jgi:hypothetical protein
VPKPLHQGRLHRRFEPAFQAQHRNRLGQIEHAGAEAGQNQPEDHRQHLPDVRARYGRAE